MAYINGKKILFSPTINFTEVSDAAPRWSMLKTYSSGDLVTYWDEIYIALKSSKAKTPLTEAEYWQPIENLGTEIDETRKAIIGRGGELSSTSDLKDFPEAIYNIPADASLAYVSDSTIAYKKSVPANVEEYARVCKIGGMTYRRKKVVNNIVSLFTSTVDMVSDATSVYWGSLVIYDDVNNPITFRAGKLYEVKTTLSLEGVYVNAIHQNRGGTEYFKGAPTADYTTDYIVISEIIADYSATVQTPIEGDTFQIEISVELVEYEWVLENTEVTALKSMGITNLFHQNLVVGGYVSDSGQFSTSSGGEKSFIFKCEANTDYTLTKMQTSVVRVSGFSNEPTNGAQGSILKRVYSASTTQVTFNSGSNNYIAVFYLNSGESGSNALVMESMMLVEGTTASDYKPSTTEPIDTLAIPVEAIKAKAEGYCEGFNSSYYNYIEWRKGRLYYIEQCPLLILNGSENWEVLNIGSNYPTYFVLKLGAFGSVVANSFLCDIFDKTTISGSNSNYGIEVINSSGYNDARLLLRIAGVDKGATAQVQLSQFKEILNNKPAKVLYTLASPRETEITDLSFPRLFKVEGRGDIIAVNEHEDSAPTTIEYIQKVGN